MRFSTSGPLTILGASIGLALAMAALRAWEVNDGVHGLLISIVGKFFAVLPRPDDAEIRSFRADSVFSITETKLILLARIAAIAISFFTVVIALLARAKGLFNPYYAGAALIGFGTCSLVSREIAFAFAIIVFASLVWLEAKNRKSRHNSSLEADAEQRRST